MEHNDKASLYARFLRYTIIDYSLFLQPKAHCLTELITINALHKITSENDLHYKWASRPLPLFDTDIIFYTSVHQNPITFTHHRA